MPERSNFRQENMSIIHICIVLYRIIVIMYIKRFRPVVVILDFKCNILTEQILLLLFIFHIVSTLTSLLPLTCVILNVITIK